MRRIAKRMNAPAALPARIAARPRGRPRIEIEHRAWSRRARRQARRRDFDASNRASSATMQPRPSPAFARRRGPPAASPSQISPRRVKASLSPDGEKAGEWPSRQRGCPSLQRHTKPPASAPRGRCRFGRSSSPIFLVAAAAEARPCRLGQRTRRGRPSPSQRVPPAPQPAVPTPMFARAPFFRPILRAARPRAPAARWHRKASASARLSLAAAAVRAPPGGAHNIARKSVRPPSQPPVPAPRPQSHSPRLCLRQRSMI